MPEDKDALVRHYNQMREALLSAIDGLSDEALAEPSLDGWSVKDHLAHISLWDEIRASEVERISAGWAAAWLPMTEEQNETFNQLIHGFRKRLPAEQIKWELAATRQRLLDAISAATARGLDGSLYREAGLRSTHEAAHTAWVKRWRGEKSL